MFKKENNCLNIMMEEIRISRMINGETFKQVK